MTICGVISEFNPFHNGHKYLLKKIKDNGFDAIVCVMSSNFVQRGEYASFDSRTRAESAVKNGADLVLSLPFPWSSSTAELFSKAAVSILYSLGCVNAIAFGSESGDIKKLQKCSDCLSEITSDEIRNYQKAYPKLSFAMARQALVEEKVGNEISSLLSSPNDILAVEYLKAIKYFNAEFQIVPIKRTSACHDGSVIEQTICSSTYLRNLLENNKTYECKPFIPENSDGQLTTYRKCDKKAFFDFLSGVVLSKEATELSGISEIGGGFEFSIYKEILTANSYDELFSSLKSRHLTDAKIRRALLFAALSVKKSNLTENPIFTEVMAANEQGRQILARVRNNDTLTVLSKVGNIKNAPPEARKQFELQRKSELIFRKFEI